MSFLDDLGDTVVGLLTLGAYDPDAKREQERMVNDQIKAYRDQTELTRQQLNESRAATAEQKRLVNKKQIRSLRQNYRAQGAGFLGVGQPAAQDTSSQLGA